MTLTQAQINAGLDAFVSEPALEDIVRTYRPDTLAMIDALMSQADDQITVPDVARAVVFLSANWDTFGAGKKAAAKARFRELRDSLTASAGVVAYVVQAIRRFKDVGDDDATVLARLEVVFALPAGDVDPVELQHLMDRAKAIWDTLA